jgi:hypothetical protein
MAEQTMVERVARVLAEKAGSSTCGFRFEEARAYFEDCARAAIAAMREPTWPMVNAASDPIYNQFSAARIVSVWNIMIDASLKE